MKNRNKIKFKAFTNIFKDIIFNLKLFFKIQLKIRVTEITDQNQKKYQQALQIQKNNMVFSTHLNCKSTWYI
jgi:hypothetical protein